MNDPIVIFFVILIMLTIAVNYSAREMVKVAIAKGWNERLTSEFTWKLLLTLILLPLLIVLI
jgi:hypothetical protein